MSKFGMSEISTPERSQALESNLERTEVTGLSEQKAEAPSRYDVPLAIALADIRNSPINNGHWEGERGDSKWIPDGSYVPEKMNPEGESWEQICDKYNIDGIRFEAGEPDFSPIARSEVKIQDFSDSRTDNFDKADISAAAQRGCSPEDVAEWRHNNGYTWHECRDMSTMQKVPSQVHNNIAHRGGISNAKVMNA